MTERYPLHYNEVALHFIRRFENLADDILDRVNAYDRLPNNIDIDPNYPGEHEIEVLSSDGEN